MVLLELQKLTVYGPVRSRRLGRSLGINPLPLDRKVCTFNCLYCQYGWTDFNHLDEPDFPSVTKILETLQSTLEHVPEPPEYITFSGNGEPSLHPRFHDIVEGVCKLRDKLVPSTRTAILSNGSTLQRDEILESLRLLDERFIKLDTGDTQTFRSYNMPVPSVSLPDIIDGLTSLDDVDVTIQALFSQGPAGNTSTGSLSAWLQTLRSVAPKSVQIYSLDRGFPSDQISPMGKRDLEPIRMSIAALGIPAVVY